MMQLCHNCPYARSNAATGLLIAFFAPVFIIGKFANKNVIGDTFAL